MCKKLQVVFLSAILFLISNFAFSESHIPKNQSKIDVGKMIKLQNQKYLMTPPKKARSIFMKTINKINDECCEEDYPKKSRLEEIKLTLEDCLNTKCENKLIPIFDPKNPPKKIISFKMIDEVDDLILDHENFKFNKLSLKMESGLSSEAEKNETIKKFEEENKKLKKTVDKMLKNYQNKITKLEEENKKLTIKYEEAFNMLPPFKQKKLKETAKD